MPRKTQKRRAEVTKKAYKYGVIDASCVYHKLTVPMFTKRVAKAFCGMDIYKSELRSDYPRDRKMCKTCKRKMRIS